MPTIAELQKQLDSVKLEKSKLQERLIDTQRENIELCKLIEKLTSSIPDDVH